MKRLSVKGNKGKNKKTYDQIMEILSIQVKENLPSKVVASRYDVTLQTVYKWRKVYSKYLDNYEKMKEEAERKAIEEKNKDLEQESTHVLDCAKRLRSLRISLNLSQQRIAEILDVSQSIYVRFEKGYGQLNSFIIKKLHKFLGINPIYLISGEGDCFSIKNIELFEKLNKEQKKYSNKDQSKQEENKQILINNSL
ncbi:helix-turn-helix transcriptional regulator [Campylobacter sp. TTU-622]|uniref:helix-turn-helix domain-containing protein n=1 Tax=Campylobacter sp. TTU-622 TaxID=2800583 RepID=UPI001908FDD0|nr:helix-turn-helix domain-containing protein [Campylobacter sp. TTU-622]MBK1973902.1 helix-turn-helix transcriptional regulator [Campylobacter sp. TTU-622]